MVVQKTERDSDKTGLPMSTAQWEAARIQRLAAISQLASMLAHQIGTPLTALSGHMQLLEEDPHLGPEARKRVKIVEAQIDRASNIIQELLHNTRRPEPEPIPVDINSCLRESIALFAQDMQRRRIVLTQLMNPDLPQPEGDQREIQEVFCHLIENALEAMPDGGTLTVQSHDLQTASGDRISRWVAIDVVDTGHGIAPEDREKIFKPFFTSKTAGHGKGLGLSIVHEIIRTHGGQILVDSEPGKGTRIRVLLPLSENAPRKMIAS